MVRVRVMVKVRIKVRFRVQHDLGFDPGCHSEPFIWETYHNFTVLYLYVYLTRQKRTISTGY